MSNETTTTSTFDRNASTPVSYNNCLGKRHCATREIDMAQWLFEKPGEKTSNLTVLPVLALLIFVVLVCLKMCSWCKDSARQKERGDVEFGDESEVNYGIIKEGDKEFCSVEIRSDTTSVYDTVNSFRLLGNGHATCLGATPAYQDTVSSYKSLLMQRADTSHYDSVKSYKAFLKLVTQNTDLDVEVKLLENYPVKCKSTEHCVVVEESSSALRNTKLSTDGKRKFRYRRASGEPIIMRKRSASNPTYSSSRKGATSLPSIHCSVSGESSADEETLASFKDERRKAFEDRCKKMSRSCSGNKLSKEYKTLEEDPDGFVKRRRHYSADGGSRPGRSLLGHGNVHYKISRAFQHELNNLRESISETDPKLESHVLHRILDDSSSENPGSSPSSRNSSISSDAIESESEDETQQVTQISAVSDCPTVNSNNNLHSSIDLLSNQSASLDGLTNADLEIFIPDGTKLKSKLSDVINANDVSSSVKVDSQNNRHTCSSTPETETKPKGLLEKNASQTSFHSHSQNEKDDLRINQERLTLHEHPSHTVAVNLRHPSLNSTQGKTASPNEDSEDTDNSLASNPRRVKRFHVTSVQAGDVASQKSVSSGGSALES